MFKMDSTTEFVEDNTRHEIKYKVCIFCLKHTQSQNNCREIINWKHFIKLWTRFVDNDMKSRFEGVLNNQHFDCCNDCSVITIGFCEMYHQLKILEMNLDWKLDSLVNVMKLANKVPSRVMQMKTTYLQNSQIGRGENENDCENTWKRELKSMKLLRHRFSKESITKLKTRGPRILLEKSVIKAEDNVTSVAKGKFDRENSSTEFFLGWFMTIIAVANMACYSPPLRFLLTELASQNYLSENVNFCRSLDQISLEDDLFSSSSSEDESQRFDEVPSPEQVPSELHENKIIDDTDIAHDNSIDINLETHNSEVQCALETKPEIKVEPENSICLHQCKICLKQYSHKHFLNRHIMSAHSKKARQYNCKICERTFSNYSKFKAHKLKMKHKLIRAIISKDSNSASANHRTTEIQESLSETTKQSVAEYDNLKSHDSGDSTSVSVSANRKPEALHNYSFRQNRKRDYATMEHDNNSHDSDKEFFHETASTRSSDSKIEVTPRKRKRQHPTKWIYCGRDNCKCYFPFGKNERYFEHQKLHLRRQIKCNFCSVVETNVQKLSLHELNEHGRKPKKLKIHGKMLFCPRCNYQTLKKGMYHNHFAECHIGGFDWRKGRKGFSFCEICNMYVYKGNGKNHFDNFHNISNLKPEAVLKCSMQNCKSYFMKEYQMQEHQSKSHQLVVDLRNSEEASQLEIIKVDMKTYFKCKLCEKVLPYSARARTHLRLYHGVNQSVTQVPNRNHSGSYICPEVKCSKCFTKPEHLKIHQTYHRNFKCSVCNVTKEYAPDLAIHEKQHVSSIKVPRKRQRTNEYKICCPRCFSGHYSDKQYIRHYLKDHLELEVIKFPCNFCKSEFATRYALRVHKDNLHGNKMPDPANLFNCDLCPASFSISRRLVSHKAKTHWKQKCPECKKEFTKSPNPNVMLRLHMEQYHPDHFPHLKLPCNQSGCWRRFATETDLQNHQKEHDEPKSKEFFECSECKKKYKGKISFQQHMNSVHVARSYICEICGKGFKIDCNLKAHMESHKAPEQWKWQCSECGRKFATKQKQEQHQRTHTKEKPFVCQFCGLKFTHQPNLRYHLKTKHTEKLE